MQDVLKKLDDELKIRNFSKQTIKSYLFSVKKFLKYSENRELNPQTVKEYIIKHLEIQNPSSVAKDSFAIKFFFENVLNEKLFIPTIKRNKTLPCILTIEEIRKIINIITNIKHKLIIKLLYGTGLRVGEIVELKRENLNFDNGLIHIYFTKGRKDRFVKILISIGEDLENYCKISNSDILFSTMIKSINH